jgi:hypothetical protein
LTRLFLGTAAHVAPLFLYVFVAMNFRLHSVNKDFAAWVCALMTR